MTVVISVLGYTRSSSNERQSSPQPSHSTRDASHRTSQSTCDRPRRILAGAPGYDSILPTGAICASYAPILVTISVVQKRPDATSTTAMARGATWRSCRTDASSSVDRDGVNVLAYPVLSYRRNLFKLFADELVRDRNNFRSFFSSDYITCVYQVLFLGE